MKTLLIAIITVQIWVIAAIVGQQMSGETYYRDLFDRCVRDDRAACLAMPH